MQYIPPKLSVREVENSMPISYLYLESEVSPHFIILKRKSSANIFIQFKLGHAK